VKRGVSLYSFQEEYLLGKLSLEGCIATAADMGATGIETLAEQMMPGFPRLGDDFYATWRGWMERYGTEPTAHDMFLDTKLYKDRELTEGECVASIVRDIEHASKLGAAVIRMLVTVTPELMARTIPIAARHGVKLCLEVHSPWHFDHEWIQRHYEVFQRFGPEHCGFLPDMGIFVERFPRVVSERFIRDGASEDVVRTVVAAYDAHEELPEVEGSPLDVGFARTAGHYVWSDPERMLDFLPYIHHIHAKFYEMIDDGGEYSIPYETIIPILA
jgi:sugar phosphate isomerase/epimerase